MCPLTRELTVINVNMVPFNNEISRTRQRNENLCYARFHFVLVGRPGGRRWGGGTPLCGIYGDVPLDRVWFLASLP